MNTRLWKHAVELVRAFLPQPPLAVHVLVPRVDDAELALATRGLTQVFSQVMRELGIEREVSVALDGRVDDADVVEVSAAGRPVAMFASPTTEWSAQVCGGTHRALLRRARVLIDDTTLEKAGNRLSGAIADGSPNAIRRTLEYLLDNGIGIQALGAEPTEYSSPCEAAERLINELAPRSLDLSVAESALRNTPDDQRTGLVDLRVALYNECGIRLPDLAIAGHTVAPGEVRVKLNDLLAPPCAIDGSATLSDIFSALRPVLVEHAAWFLRVDDVEAQRAELGSVIPDLVRLSKGQLPTWLLTACLRALMANSDSVRNLPRIVWLLLESGPPHDGIDEVMLATTFVESLPAAGPIDSDPEMLASMVRRLIAYEAWGGGGPPPDTPLMSVPIEWESALLRASDATTIGKTEWRIVRAVCTAGEPDLVVAHTVAATGPLRQALRALPNPPRVIASQELPPDTPLPTVFNG